MKHGFLLLSVMVFFSSGVRLYSQDHREVQLSGGFEAAFGKYTVDDSFWFNSGDYYFFCSENTATTFFAPGISLMTRAFSDSVTPVSYGLVFRDRAVFLTNYKYTSTGSVNGISFSESGTQSDDDDTFISSMDFGLGLSTRFIASEKIRFYVDFGANLTIFESENSVDESLSSYLGMGIFSQLSLQVFLTKKLYLEFGIDAITNIVSNTKNEFRYPFGGSNIKIEYTGTGRRDLTSIGVYIQFGGLLLRNDRGAEKAAVRSSETNASETDTDPGVEEQGIE
jgi:hypothetical protein